MANNKDPLELKSDDAGQNDQIRAATTTQSSVKPEQYSDEHRAMQAAIVGGDGVPSTKEGEDKNGD